MNYVDKMLVEKDRLRDWKKSSEEMCFTDDGFALGLACILRILGQDAQFDSLHWFDSIEAALTTKRENIGGKGHHGLKASVNRLESIEKEFDLLFYSFSGARIFFRVANEPPKTNSDKASA